MRTALITLAVAALALPVLASQPFSTAEVNCPDVSTGLVVEARKSVRLAEMTAFQAALEDDNDRLVIDVREPAEYEAGHIPEAINIPRGLIEFMIWKHVGNPDDREMEKSIYLYCNSGGCASLSGKSLQDLGFRQCDSRRHETHRLDRGRASNRAGRLTAEQGLM